MSSEFLDEVRRLTREFFDLPMEEKLKYSREENEIEGYGNDMVLSDKQILDWTDRLYLTVYPEQSRRFNYWPTNPQRFRYFFFLKFFMNLSTISLGLMGWVGQTRPEKSKLRVWPEL